MSRIMADAHTVGKNLKYDLNENGSYFSVTPRSSFRSVGSRRLDDFDDDSRTAAEFDCLRIKTKTQSSAAIGNDGSSTARFFPIELRKLCPPRRDIACRLQRCNSERGKGC
ncbi:unnamed protein product [Cyprideis torosa]|uniref:Uncharacterized protein n=1 Tax=Cyprideis torosa TaxID=163714 RepID=A0A7R8W0Z4_9CRUS|nr:unnamed protein product [Cyprideis torosa]CAG0880325.1 unnamed protein product [Cyprideis torosa]